MTLDQQQTSVGRLDLWQSAYNFLGSMDNQVSNQLCSHLLDMLKFFQYCHIVILISFFTGWSNDCVRWSRYYNLYKSTSEKKKFLSPVLTALSTKDKIKGLFTTWKISLIKKYKYSLQIFVSADCSFQPWL